MNAEDRIAELQEQLSQALTRAEAAERELRHERQATAAASAVGGKAPEPARACTCGICHVRRIAPAIATGLGLVRMGTTPFAGLDMSWYASDGVGALVVVVMSQAAWQSVASPALLAAIEQGKLPRPTVTT